MRRIVSLLPSATEMLFALGVGEWLVGVSHECNFPSAANVLPRVTRSNIDSSQDSAAIDRQVRTALDNSSSLYALDVEQISKLRPHLVITQSQCDVCAIKLEDVRELLASSTDLADTDLITLAPTSIAEVFDDMRRLSAAVGHSAEETSELLAPFHTRVDEVRRQTSTTTETPKVVIVEWLAPPMAAGNWTPELVGWAGGLYGLAKGGAHSPYITWDALVEYQPDIVILAPCGFDLERTVAEGQSFVQDSRFLKLPAARTERVYFLDGDAYLNRSGPRLVDTLEILAHLLHPELVANLHPAAWKRLQT